MIYYLQLWALLYFLDQVTAYGILRGVWWMAICNNFLLFLLNLFPQVFKLAGKDMAAAYLSGHLCVPTNRKKNHFNAALFKPEYFFP